MCKRSDKLKEHGIDCGGCKPSAASGVMPNNLHDLFYWHERLKTKNGYMVLSKQDRKIIDLLVDEKAKAMGNGPKNPPRVSGDNPRA